VVPPVTEPSHAVFLSYASQDAEAAQRICEALRAAGIEVWLDQSELRGGEAWDRKIRKEIHDCALFIPIISANAHARVEGYFRLEWKLAVDRSHLMAPDRTFLLPVVVDDTPQTDERIPDRFRELQWTRCPGGQASPAFMERVQRLLSSAQADAPTPAQPATVPASTATQTAREPVRASWRGTQVLLVIVVVVVAGGLAYFAIDKLWSSKHPTSPAAPPSAPASVASAAFAPPPHSIAVLPFVNMSGDKEQEYFSDGLTEEILNSLARVNELQVSARTSAFSFKGKDVKIGTIARELNVGSILEGSVRRSGHTIRVTAQLNNAMTGFHLWSQTYDRDLSDVLKLQTDIANAVAGALRVTLLGDVAAKIEVGGTRNPAAFDSHLRAYKAYNDAQSDKDLQVAIAGFSEAIRLDSDYALAYADRSMAFDSLSDWAKRDAARDYLDKARVDGQRAIALAPDLAEGHLALAWLLEYSLEFIRASQEYERAMVLAPGNARVLNNYGLFAASMGRTEDGLVAAHRSVVLDPLNPDNHFTLGRVLAAARRYNEAIASFRDANALNPNEGFVNGWVGSIYYLTGDFQSARTACEGPGIEVNNQFCLALVYDRLGRHAEAESMLRKVRAFRGGTLPVQCAMVYAAWGDIAHALDWLETAMRNRDRKRHAEAILTPTL
jgi:TolB-like protein/Flp pilus assembly protein TadD